MNSTINYDKYFVINNLIELEAAGVDCGSALAINNLAEIESLKTARTAQNPQCRYKSGTAQQ